MYTTAGILDMHRMTTATNARLLKHCALFTAEELGREHAGFGHKSLRQTLLHMGDAEAWWLSRLTGKESEEWDYSQYQEVDAVAAKLSATAAEMAAFIEEQPDVYWDEPIAVPMPGGTPHIAPAHVVLHVCTHHFHHKGQCAAMFRLLGQPNPDTDIM
jgi:uncharacterized damage-inducible protein DinB